ncbi:hypothetical protein ACQ4PT_037721 [Festuca glaucescens]
MEDNEEHDMVVNETFSSEEEGYKYYNAYAKSKGFGVRKEELTKKPGTDIAFRRLYVCSKEGYRAKKHFEKTKRKRTPRPLLRCGCGARMEIEMSMESGEWFVKDFMGEHNHPLAIGDQTAFIRSHRGLNDAQKADAIEYGIGGLQTHEIMEVMEKQHGGPEKVGFVPRDLYNFFAKYKKERIEDFVEEYEITEKDAWINRMYELRKKWSRAYTKVMFKKVKHQIDQMPKWEVAKVTKQDTVVVYAVALKERRDVMYDVKLTMASPMVQGVNCRCLKMETEEIPCTHIFSVLKFLGLISVPRCCISRRWTMLAKPAFESERKANMHDWSEWMDRYHNLCNMSNLFLFNAASSPEKSQKVLDFLKSLMPDVGEDNRENEAASFGPLTAYFSGADQTFTGKVLDPKTIIPKGGPSKNNKRWKPLHETWKPNK